MQLADLPQAERILPSQFWKVEGTEEGETNLTAVRVTGKLKVDGIVRGLIGEIGFMREQDNRLRRRHAA